MGFKDSNGQITIDEMAAQKDICNLSQSAESLNSALENINQIISVSAEFKGNSAAAINENAVILKRRIETLISEISESAEYIKNTVSRYQLTDGNLKTFIDSY